MTNFHDLLCLLCSDFQLRVVKSAFKAAWVVLRGERRWQPALFAAMLWMVPIVSTCFSFGVSSCCDGVAATVVHAGQLTPCAHEGAAQSPGQRLLLSAC